MEENLLYKLHKYSSSHEVTRENKFNRTHDSKDKGLRPSQSIIIVESLCWIYLKASVDCIFRLLYSFLPFQLQSLMWSVRQNTTSKHHISYEFKCDRTKQIFRMLFD
jgi:hypothetical protein